MRRSETAKRRGQTLQAAGGKARLVFRAYAFLLPSLLGTAVFVLLPYLDVFFRSFHEAISSHFVGFQNYREVIKNQAFWLAFKNTARFLAVCIPLLFFLSLGMAVLIDGLRERTKLIRTTLLVPLAIPVASIVLLWRLFFHQQGIFNQILSGLGSSWAGWDWMNRDTAFSILVATYLWKNAGYDMVLWLAGLGGIPEELYEAARVDGASEVKRFFWITVPCLSKTAGMVAILSLFRAFQVFREAYLIAGDYPHENIYLLQHLFNNWLTSLDMPKISAASVLMLLTVCMIVVLFYFTAGKKIDSQ